MWTQIANFAPLSAPTKLCLLRDTPKTPIVKKYNIKVIIMYKKRTKSIILKFRVTQEEKEIIELRAVQANKKSTSAYLRKIALTGVIVNYDNQELKELRKSLIGISTNINQIATRVNSTNRYYDDDIQYMKKVLNNIWQSLNSVQSNLRLLSQ